VSRTAWWYPVRTEFPFASTVASHTGTTTDLSGATTVDIPTGTLITFTTMTADFVDGSTITGGTSGATWNVARVTELGINVKNVTGVFVNGETVTGINGATAKLIAAPVAQELDTLYQQDFGQDKVVDQQVEAIKSSFTSRNFGFAVGDPFNDVPKTVDIMTSLGRLRARLQPVGDLTVTVQGRSYANQAMADLDDKTFAAADSYVDFRAQDRILRLKVESNTVGGFYEQGQVFMDLEPGDEQPSVAS
jgi:hypothetical protein